MSGIFGILRYDGDAAAAADLERMANVLRHRGPDGRRQAVTGAAGLGHLLMRVNQEDRFEAQPVRDRARGLTLVADCRLDNREALAEQLHIGPAALADMPDSALLLRAYAEWNDGCAEHLVGDFAFAVWDARAAKLLLGRDHMGQRTLFYHPGERFIAFASEIEALWALADVPRALLDDQIGSYFQRGMSRPPEGATLYQSILFLPGGTTLSAHAAGSSTKRRYWAPRPDPAHEGKDEAYYVQQYRSVLAEAVACRLRRLHDPAALLMSAGFDTGAVAGLAAPVVTRQNRKLISLSWVGSDDGHMARGDLRPWLEACRRVMPHLDIRQITGKTTDPLEDLPAIFRAYGGPGPGSRRTILRLYAEAAAAGARVVMDGYGGDYTLNPRGAGALARLLRKGRFLHFASEVGARLRQPDVSAWRLFKHEVLQMLLPRRLVSWQRRIRRVGTRAATAMAALEIEGPLLAELRRRNAAAPSRSPASVSPANMREGIRGLADEIALAGGYVRSTAAAAHGLELTRPFHDKRVVELGLAIPEDLYVKDGLNRYLARRALSDIYPPEFQTRGRLNEGALLDQPILDLAAPGLRAEAARYAGSPGLRSYFDFEKVGRTLARPVVDARTHAAIRALLIARFMEWFSRPNAP